jgi:hypothetical protein
MKSLILGVLLSFAVAFSTQAADLVWDHPTDYNTKIGWIVYFNETANPGTVYNRTILKSDITTDSTTITYADIEDKLDLHYNIEYEIKITAYSDVGETAASNTVTYTRDGFIPPTDSLPEPIDSTPPDNPMGFSINLI